MTTPEEQIARVAAALEENHLPHLTDDSATKYSPRHQKHVAYPAAFVITVAVVGFIIGLLIFRGILSFVGMV